MDTSDTSSIGGNSAPTSAVTTEQVFEFLRSCDEGTYGELQKRWEEAEGRQDFQKA